MIRYFRPLSSMIFCRNVSGAPFWLLSTLMFALCSATSNRSAPDHVGCSKLRSPHFTSESCLKFSGLASTYSGMPKAMGLEDSIRREIARYRDSFANQCIIRFKNALGSDAYLCTIYSDGKHRDVLLRLEKQMLISMDRTMSIEVFADSVVVTAQGVKSVHQILPYN